MVTPLLGLFLAMVLAAVLGQARTLKVLAAVTLAGAAGMMAAVLLFVLDYLQLRASVTAEAIALWDAASRKAILAGLLGIGVMVVLGISGWRAVGRMRATGDVNVGLFTAKGEKA
jgi:hypothetical protein